MVKVLRPYLPVEAMLRWRSDRRDVAFVQRLRPVAICALTLLHLSGCAIHGPKAMGASRLAYNEAVQRSEQQELLLNLVRLRYTDAPEFFAINGISTQMTIEASASVGGVFGQDADADTSLLAPGAAVVFSENPTITFTPQRDQTFTRQLAAPIEIDSIYLLARHGWGIDRVLRLVAGRVNGLSNEFPRETGTAESLAEIDSFSSAVSLLRRFEKEGLIRVDVEMRREIVAPVLPVETLNAQTVLATQAAGLQIDYSVDSPGYLLSRTRHAYVLQIVPAAWKDADFRLLTRRLALQAEASSYEIDPGMLASEEPGNRIFVETRSPLAVMAYLSTGVNVPESHRREGLVDSDMALTAHFRPLLQVEVADAPVDKAYLGVFYRGYWFYLRDDDLESKRSLGLLMSLLRLSISAGGADNVPVLTLPVGR